MMKPIEIKANEAAARMPEVSRPAQGALAALSLSMLLSALGTSSANVALPTLTQAFGASLTEVQWVVVAYLLAITTAIVGAGRLGDMTGRRRLLSCGLLLFTAASALSAVAPTLWLLILARGAQGIGAAAMMSLTIAFVGDTVPKARAASTMGLLATMSAVGTALGPSLGGLLISNFGWRSIFLINVPLGLAAVALAAFCLPKDRPSTKAREFAFDVPGAVLLAFALAAYALSMTFGRGSFGLANAALLLAAALGMAIFARVEQTAPAPLVSIDMLRNPQLGPALAASTLVSTVMMATLVVSPFYLSRALALDAAQVGIVISVGPLVVALTGVPAGLVADRIGTRRVMLAGLVAIATGAALLYALPAVHGVPGYVVPLVVVTAGYALFQTANNAEVMSGISAESRGVASGLLNLSRNLGLVTGASAMGAVFGIATGTKDIASAPPEAVAFGMQITFAVAAGLMVAALGIVSARKR